MWKMKILKFIFKKVISKLFIEKTNIKIDFKGKY